MLLLNWAQVGFYDARCLESGCTAVIRIPVNAHQRVADNPMESTIVTEPDLANAWDHYNLEHAPNRKRNA